jgi:hypothetical protein
MPTFSADQIIGKTLIAKKPVAIYAAPGQKSIATVAPGDPVGVVYSYIGGTGGNPLFWQFYVKTAGVEKAYYAKHETDAFNNLSLTDQGVKTTAEIEKEKAQAELTPIERAAGAVGSGVKKILIWGGVYLGAFLLLREFIRKK